MSIAADTEPESDWYPFDAFLEKLRPAKGGMFESRTVFITFQMLDLLRKLHDRGVTHGYGLSIILCGLPALASFIGAPDSVAAPPV